MKSGCYKMLRLVEAKVGFFFFNFKCHENWIFLLYVEKRIGYTPLVIKSQKSYFRGLYLSCIIMTN